MKKLYSNLAEHPDARPRRSICPTCGKGLWINEYGEIICKKCGVLY